MRKLINKVKGIDASELVRVLVVLLFCLAVLLASCQVADSPTTSPTDITNHGAYYGQTYTVELVSVDHFDVCYVLLDVEHQPISMSCYNP